MKKTITIMSLAIMLSVFTWAPVAQADNHGKIAGKFFLQVEANGELWYILPETGERYYIKNPSEAMNLVRLTGIGISNEHLSHIPAAGDSGHGPFDMALTNRMAGKFLLQVESKGEAWYLNPMDMKRYYLGRDIDAFNLFASIATGISNEVAVSIPEAKSIVDVAVGAGNFNTLVAAVQAAGLAETLDQGGPFTVFAPTDEAFAKLPEGTVESLLGDIPTLTNILLYHVVPGKVMAKDVLGLSEAKTLNGQSFKIDTSDGVMVDNAKVSATDIMAVNGVVHVIDTVILPPDGNDETMTMEPEMNIIETAKSAGSFNILLAAIDAAGLTDTLSNDGPFTVFAPTDEAFGKLPEGTVDSLLADIPALTDILLYHVVSGEVPASQVVNLTEATTLQGTNVDIDTMNGVKVDNANVVTTDIMTSNGIIHVIDQVITP